MATFAERDGLIWMDGEMVPWRQAQVHCLTHTLHYGMGVFEGLRAYATAAGPAIFRLHDHTRRLFNSAKIVGMQINHTADEINRACIEAVRQNELSSAYLRPMTFYGSEGMGLHAEGLRTHTMVAAWQWGAYLGDESRDRGIRVQTSSFTRHHVNISMCRAKANGHYMNSMLAVQEATRAGCDEALLLDVDGFVCEGSGENFFMVRDGVLYTPCLTSALEGITRDTVIRLAGEESIEVVEKRITRDEVYIADEAFFTGTAAEVTPIRELDGRTIGTGRRGPVTERLQGRYFDLVEGRDPRHAEWLTTVA